MLKWNDSFSVGIEEIDNQHKKLFDFGLILSDNHLNYFDKDFYDDIVNTINELKEYAIYHFETEEKLLYKYKFDDYESHKKEHDEFIEYLEKFDIYYIDKNQQSTIEELNRFVISWIFRHISYSDYKYSEFLKNAINSTNA